MGTTLNLEQQRVEQSKNGIKSEAHELNIKQSQFESEKKLFAHNKERELSQIEHERKLLQQQKNGIILEQEKVRKDIEALKYQKQQQNLAQLAMSQSSTFYSGMNGFYANQNSDDLKLKQREFDLNKLENELAAKQMNLDKKKIEIELKEKELADAIFKYNQNQKEMQNEQ